MEYQIRLHITIFLFIGVYREHMSYSYQFDPPIANSVTSLRVKDLDFMSDGDSVGSWGAATPMGGAMTFKNDGTFPYVKLNNTGYMNLGQLNIAPSQGFTYIGLVYTTSVGPQYPILLSYATSANNGLRIYRTGGSGQDLVFRSQKASSIEARANGVTTTNKWQVFTARVTDNGDSTITMEIFVDSVLQGATTAPSTGMEGITSGLLEVGQSTRWTNQPVSPIHISDCFFYDRALFDVELLAMYSYLVGMGDPYSPPSMPVTVTPRPLSLSVSFGAVADAVAYMLTVQKAGGQAVRTVDKGFTDLSSNIRSLKPETDYTVRLYTTTDGVEYTLHLSTDATTTANTASNYSVSDFASQDGTGFNLSDLSTDSVKSLLSVMNELFTTGDEVCFPVKGKKVKTRFVRRGGTIDLVQQESSDSISISVPFSTNGGIGQSVSLTLSDNSSVSVAYDETTEAITVAGVAYVAGDSFSLDGKKVTIIDI